MRHASCKDAEEDLEQRSDGGNPRIECDIRATLQHFGDRDQAEDTHADGDEAEREGEDDVDFLADV